MKSPLFNAIYVSVLIIAISPSHLLAMSITSSNELVGSTNIIDFSQFHSTHLFSTGPVQIGDLVGLDITVSSSSSSLALWNGAYGLGANGNWGLRGGSMSGYLATQTLAGPDGAHVRIDFNDGDVSGFGGFMNYDPNIIYGPVTFAAYNNLGEILELFNIVNDAPIISKPSALDDGAFRGIQRSQADVSYVVLSGDHFVLDDFTFTSQVSTVPVPAALWLFGSGLIGLIGFAKRKRA